MEENKELKIREETMLNVTGKIELELHLFCKICSTKMICNIPVLEGESDTYIKGLEVPALYHFKCPKCKKELTWSYTNKYFVSSFGMEDQKFLISQVDRRW